MASGIWPTAPYPPGEKHRPIGYYWVASAEVRYRRPVNCGADGAVRGGSAVHTPTAAGFPIYHVEIRYLTSLERPPDPCGEPDEGLRAPDVSPNYDIPPAHQSFGDRPPGGPEEGAQSRTLPIYSQYIAPRPPYAANRASFGASPDGVPCYLDSPSRFWRRLYPIWLWSPGGPQDLDTATGRWPTAQVRRPLRNPPQLPFTQRNRPTGKTRCVSGVRVLAAGRSIPPVGPLSGDPNDGYGNAPKFQP